MSDGRVLVTGANGFIGRAVVAALVARSTPVTAAVRRQVDLPGARVSVVPGLARDTDWTDALRGCRTVVHAAARVHVMRDGEGDPIAAYRAVNVEGATALAEQAAAAGVRRFVALSSIKVNGERTPDGSAFTEADPPHPSDPYGISKAEGEKALTAVASRTGMEVVIIRPPLVYGPGVKANFLAMTRWLAKGVPLPLGAITRNRRTLVALDNLVDLILTCVTHPAAANELFLAGDGEDLSTTELLCRTARALGVRPRLVPVPRWMLVAAASAVGRGDLATRLCESLRVDASKARRVLGWTPPISVDEGLRRAVLTSGSPGREPTGERAA